MKLLISATEIEKAVEKVASQINALGRPVQFIVILKGAVCLIADLIRKLTLPCELAFISASSYGMRGHAPGPLKISGCDSLDLRGKEVIIVDDICDTGMTLFKVRSAIEVHKPQNVKTLVLLNKRRSCHRPIDPDMFCFNIENFFVVGYGLDYREQHRGLPDIYVMDS